MNKNIFITKINLLADAWEANQQDKVLADKMKALVEEFTTAHYYTVFFDRKVLAPSTKYHETPSNCPVFRDLLIKAGYALGDDPRAWHHPISGCQDFGSVGYDDVCFWFGRDREAAIDFAKRMDNVLPGPTLAYRKEYMISGHHAQVAVFSDNECSIQLETIDPQADDVHPCSVGLQKVTTQALRG